MIAMSTSKIDLLNELLVIHSCSLPSYLGSWKPWARQGDQQSLRVLRNMSAEHSRMADRIARVITRYGGYPDRGSFPMLFTDMHDLSTDYIVRNVREFQKRDLRRIEEIAESLAAYPDAHAVAQECLGAAKAHLDLLNELESPRLKVLA
jgi:hypothetical protein